MNNTTDLLNLGRCDNVKTRSITSSKIKSVPNETFTDVLKTQRKKTVDCKRDINRNNYSDLNNVTVFNVTNISSSKKGIEFLNKLNTMVSDKSTDSNTKIKSLNDIVEEIDKVFLKITDVDLSVEEKSEITEEALQSLIAMLDNFINTSQNTISFEDIDSSLITDIRDISSTLEAVDLNTLDTDANINTIISVDDISQSLDNVAEKITSLFNDNSNTEENAKLLNFMNKLSAVISKSDDKITDTGFDIDLTKKEDISANINNLDMSSILNNNVEAIDFRSDKVENLHPVAKQILQTMQSKLASVNLDGKTVEIRLKLYPSKLGKISVVIGRSGDDVNVSISSDNADVRRLLSDSISILKNDLAESNSGSINIDISNGNSNEESRQNNNNNNTIAIPDNLNKYVEDVTLKLQVSNSLTNKILDIKL